VRASGVPLFQAATVNVNPGTEAEVDTGNPDRCRSSTAKDHTAPWAIVNASYQRQKSDPA